MKRRQGAPAQAAPVLAVVGGFLGAGKTSLLLKAATVLRSRGMRTAILTNDQGGELVDTRLSAAAGLVTGEVAGGCFCCRFSDFMRAAGRLRAFGPDVIFAEPVGSCVDLAATTLEPIRRFHGARFRLAPFTVLVEPRRAAEALGPEADPYIAYLFRNQLAEADVVCLTKADLRIECPELPVDARHRLSALTGEGVAEWLDCLLAKDAKGGGRMLDIDYGRYAEAEAALGWLNLHARLRLRRALSPAAVAGPLLGKLDQALSAAGLAVVHLKIFDAAATGYVKASVCRNGEEPWVDGALDAAPALRHDLVLNLRARAAPEALRSIVAGAAESIPGSVRVLHFEAFRPAAPHPQRRLPPEPA